MRAFQFGVIGAVVPLVVVLDQLTKWIVESTMELYELIPVIPGFFNLTRTYNYGAAFGMFSGMSDGWREAVLVLTATVALIVVGYFLRHPHYQGRLSQVSLSMVLGGAIGNLIDRFFRGAVVDFLDFYVATYHWPAFNIADSAICIGVACMLFGPIGIKADERSEAPGTQPE